MFILHFAVQVGLVVRGYGREWCEVSVFCLWSAVVDSLCLLRVGDVAVLCKQLRRVHCRGARKRGRSHHHRSAPLLEPPLSETKRRDLYILRSNYIGFVLWMMFGLGFWSQLMVDSMVNPPVQYVMLWYFFSPEGFFTTLLKVVLYLAAAVDTRSWRIRQAFYPSL